MVKTIMVPKEAIIKGAYKSDLVDEDGKIKQFDNTVAKQFIPKNSQVCTKMIAKKDFYVGENQSIFYIPRSWINAMSTSIRRGDTVEIRTEDGNKSYGTYKVAFAKGDDETEITDGDNKYTDELDRVQSTGVVTHVEIICTLEKYKELYEYATGAQYVAGANANAETIAVHKYLITQKF